MLLICIDVGIINMGIAVVEAASYDDMDCRYADKFDITDFVCGPDCDLPHDSVMSDWVAHFIRRHEAYFDAADVVLIERQPPMGHRCTEQLLFNAYRDKAVLIHPRSFHCFFNISTMNYEDRKRALVAKAKQYFARSEIAQAALSQERAHDIADAMLFSIYYVNQPVVKSSLCVTKRKHSIVNTEAYFRTFVYTGEAKKKYKHEKISPVTKCCASNPSIS